MNESVLLLIYQVKTISITMAGCKNQLIRKRQNKFLVFSICHIEFIADIKKFAIASILV